MDVLIGSLSQLFCEYELLVISGQVISSHERPQQFFDNTRILLDTCVEQRKHLGYIFRKNKYFYPLEAKPLILGQI